MNFGGLREEFVDGRYTSLSPKHILKQKVQAAEAAQWLEVCHGNRVPFSQWG